MACRQLFRRAKQHITANKPRFDANPEHQERLVRTFVQVVETGELVSFLQMLVEDVKLVPDAGGERGAAIQVLRGRDAVAAFILGIRRIEPADVDYELVTLNGQRAILARTADERPYFAVLLYGDADRVSLIHVIAGRKLRHI